MDELTFRRIAAAAAVAIGTLSAGGGALASNWAVLLASGSTAQSQSLTLSAPTSVAAACTASNQKTIIVSWAAVAHAASYTVFQSTTSALTGYSQVATGVATTSWTSASLATGKQYWYEVTVTVGTNWISVKSAATGSTTISSTSPNCKQP